MIITTKIHSYSINQTSRMIPSRRSRSSTWTRLSKRCLTLTASQKLSWLGEIEALWLPRTGAYKDKATTSTKASRLIDFAITYQSLATPKFQAPLRYHISSKATDLLPPLRATRVCISLSSPTSQIRLFRTSTSKTFKVRILSWTKFTFKKCHTWSRTSR